MRKFFRSIWFALILFLILEISISLFLTFQYAPMCKPGVPCSPFSFFPLNLGISIIPSLIITAIVYLLIRFFTRNKQNP